METPWRPMEPVLWPEPFDDARWLFQPKWDGVRGLAVVEGGRVRIFSRGGRERTDRYPELGPALIEAVGASACALDGEVVALQDGRPSFERVMRRAMAGAPLANRVPVHYAVFDLVALDGLDLRGRPLDERLRRLAAVLHPSGLVLGTPVHSGGGRALFAAVRERGLEGVVAKRGDSPYVGGRSGLWRKVKVRRRRACLVAGYMERGGGLRSLMIAEREADGRLRDLGAVGSGLTEAVRRELAGLLRALPAVSPPYPPPRAPSADLRFTFVAPVLRVLVEYAELGSNGRLRAPVFVGLERTPPGQG